MVKFIGNFSHNLDAKNRIIIPARFRDGLENEFYLTKGYDGCLAIYSNEQFEKRLEMISRLPETKENARKFRTVVMGSTSPCELDNQGRIQIPANLCAIAGLKKACVVLGMGDHIEIWDEERWNAYYNDASVYFEKNAENLDELLKN